MNPPGCHTPLDAEFFRRDALAVARDLLGARLCLRSPDGNIQRLILNEVEAYTGPDDRACHAHKGRTARTEVMFGPPGIWYVYLCYGMHWMLNIVTGDIDYPAAVLLRGATAVTGPGRLTRQLAITGAWNGSAATPTTGLWLEDGQRIPETDIKRTPRIGVSYAGPDWANRPYRLLWK